MERLYAIIIVLLIPTQLYADNPNWYIKDCRESIKFDDTKNWSELASCTSFYVNEKQKQKAADYRDFLKANPRYRYPGQSLNRCFGKPREMPFKKSKLSVSETGMSAEIWYKDKLPAGCFENAPWDNRDNNNARR